MPEDFERAGQNPWLALAAASLVFIAAWRLFIRLRNTPVNGAATAGIIPHAAAVPDAQLAARRDM